MSQASGTAQAIMSEATFSFSDEAKAAPYNAAATVVVELSVVAEKEALSCLHAFCTFLGKVHEAGPLSTWSISDEREASTFYPRNSTRSADGETGCVPEDRPLAVATFELPLGPFSMPASFCEQLVKDSVTFTVVRTAESASEVPQRREPQPKGFGNSDGKEKGGKKAGPSRPIIPPGDSRTAEMPAGMLLLLRDGERMQAPDVLQKTLTTLPGMKAVKSLLSPELRHLLNPVWLLIKDVRFIPNTSRRSLQSPSAPASASDSNETSEDPSGKEGPPTLGSDNSLSDAPLEYFARAYAFSKVFETEPKAPSCVSAGSRVCWNAGFLCFWGPSVVNQNELKDFIEEKRLQIELHHTAECPEGADPSDFACAPGASESRKTISGRGFMKQQKVPLSAAAKIRRATAKPQRSAGVHSENGSPSGTCLSGCCNGVKPAAGVTTIRAPHGVACFRLSALGSCGATSLSLCTEVLPVAGYAVRAGETDEAVSVCRVSGPDFISSGTRMTVEIRLAEPLFQCRHLPSSPDPAGMAQDGDAVAPNYGEAVPHQQINRLFLSAPLQSQLATEATRIGERAEAFARDVPECQGDEGREGARAREGDLSDVLTGFLIEDGRLLYAVLEGLAHGRLAEAAERLLLAAGKDGGETEKLLYNSRLRFSHRRYPMASSLQRLKLVSPLEEVATSRAMLDGSTPGAQSLYSAVSKLQMAALFSRAADLKCHDLFPTSEELECIRRYINR